DDAESGYEEDVYQAVENDSEVTDTEEVQVMQSAGAEEAVQEVSPDEVKHAGMSTGEAQAVERIIGADKQLKTDVGGASNSRNGGGEQGSERAQIVYQAANEQGGVPAEVVDDAVAKAGKGSAALTKNVTQVVERQGDRPGVIAVSMAEEGSMNAMQMNLASQASSKLAVAAEGVKGATDGNARANLVIPSPVVQVAEAGAKNFGSNNSGGNGFAGFGADKALDKMLASKGSKGTSSLPSRSQEKLVEKIKEMLSNAAVTRQNNTMVLRVKPEHLGAMTVKITHKADQVSARITPDSPEVEALLRSKVGELAQVLAATGLKLENVQVSIGAERTESEMMFFQDLNQQSMGQEASDSDSNPELKGHSKGLNGEEFDAPPTRVERPQAEVGWVA
ncbi:hypothetical protein BVY02_00830, partial [bacterium J17]